MFKVGYIHIHLSFSYLFLLAAEGLSCLLNHRSQSSNLSGIKVASSAPPVNHLLFADDSLLFFKANGEGATEISESLSLYCQASGQRINLQKSSIFFSKGCSQMIRDEVKLILNVSNESLSEKYLGMPTDVGKSKNGAFKYLKDRVWQKVQGWMEQILSAGGKEVLIKAVAQAVPVFSMACFKLPRGLCQHIDSIIRKFWWGSKEGERKTAWVSWEEMTKPKYMGGLGFRDTELFNLALLARQAWRILQDPNTLSARIIKAVYYPQGDFLEAELGFHPSQIWRALVEGKEVLSRGLIRRIGNGETTRIWNQNWIPREEMMRPLACLAAEPPTMVSELIDVSSASWDVEKIQKFFVRVDANLILGLPICTRNIEDFWSWNFEKKGIFTVRSAYRMLVETKQRREAWLDGRASSSDTTAESKSWTTMWKVKVPSKIRVFLWRLAKQSLPTSDLLHHRNMSTTSTCVLCGAADSWRHSLIECRMARCVWALSDEEQLNICVLLWNLVPSDGYSR
jgi:hypothetical protein